MELSEWLGLTHGELEQTRGLVLACGLEQTHEELTCVGVAYLDGLQIQCFQWCGLGLVQRSAWLVLTRGELRCAWLACSGEHCMDSFRWCEELKK